MQRGDLALCYASGWQTIFAIVEIDGDPENDPTRERWRWRVSIRPLTVLTNVAEAPPVEAAGVFPRSLGRHSYIRLSEDQFASGSDAIQAAASTRS